MLLMKEDWSAGNILSDASLMKSIAKNDETTRW